MEWTLISITLTLCCIRFTIRYRRGRGLNICDIFVALGWIFYLAQGAMDTVLYEKGLFDNKLDPTRAPNEYGPQNGLATFEDTVIILK